MGLLDKFEARLDRLVNGSFAKAFPGDLQPIEIVGKLQKEMTERAAVVSRSRTVVPNEFTVYISQDDASRLESYTDEVAELLSESVREFAAEQRYTFLGPVHVYLESRSSLQKGMVLVASQTSKPNPSQVDAGSPGSPGSVGTSLHPRLVDSAGTSFNLVSESSDHIVLGRGTDVDIRFEDTSVSRRHAEIVVTPAAVYIKDLGSTNGTFVDGARVQQQQLSDGSVIRLGSTDVTFRSS